MSWEPPRNADAQLVRAIGVPGLAANIINTTIGASIFALPALVAQGLGAAAPIAFKCSSPAWATWPAATCESPRALEPMSSPMRSPSFKAVLLTLKRSWSCHHGWHQLLWLPKRFGLSIETQGTRQCPLPCSNLPRCSPWLSSVAQRTYASSCCSESKVATSRSGLSCFEP